GQRRPDRLVPEQPKEKTDVQVYSWRRSPHEGTYSHRSDKPRYSGPRHGPLCQDPRRPHRGSPQGRADCARLWPPAPCDQVRSSVTRALPQGRVFFIGQLRV
ncbi:MAG: hypothetical protein ACK55Z_19225, partial [bacterium]